MRRGHIFAVVLLAFQPRLAHAYRPFDATDAAVVAPGEFELELGPVGYLQVADVKFLIAPGATVNLGVVPDWEVVLQGRHFVLLDGPSDEPRSRVLDAGLFAKGVLRDGTLQGALGPSVAIEVGPLLPNINDDSGFGAAAIGIVSQRWPALTAHVNAAAAYTRDHNFDLLGGAIVEGPFDWTVRPVAETFVEREFDIGTTYSALAGVIWRLHDTLSLDSALRVARVDEEDLFEVRAGLTWTTALWGAR